MDALGLHSTRPSGQFWINWWLMNHCNYRCSYCHDLIKSGSIELIALDRALDFVNQAGSHCQRQGLQMNIDLTGGEVTQWVGLDSLLTHIKGWGAWVKIRTNASQSLTQFKDTLALLNAVQLDYHPEHTSTSHFLMCVGAAAVSGVAVYINVNMLPDRWQETQAVVDSIKRRYPSVIVNSRMLFEDPTKNTQPMDYTPVQKQEFKNQKKDLIWLKADGSSQPTDYQTMVLEQTNVFTGWRCHAGVEQIIVDAWGRVRRGHCGQNQSLGTLGDQLTFDSSPVTCTRVACVNSFDIQATKIKTS